VVTTNNNTAKYINNTTGGLGASLSNTNYRRPFISFSHTSCSSLYRDSDRRNSNSICYECLCECSF
jgi:hypothetical protein